MNVYMCSLYLYSLLCNRAPWTYSLTEWITPYKYIKKLGNGYSSHDYRMVQQNHLLPYHAMICNCPKTINTCRWIRIYQILYFKNKFVSHLLHYQLPLFAGRIRESIAAQHHNIPHAWYCDEDTWGLNPVSEETNNQGAKNLSQSQMVCIPCHWTFLHP